MSRALAPTLRRWRMERVMCIYIYIYVHVDVYVYVNVCVYMYIYIYMIYRKQREYTII